jgi:hypothetical protein
MTNFLWPRFPIVYTPHHNASATLSARGTKETSVRYRQAASSVWSPPPGNTAPALEKRRGVYCKRRALALRWPGRLTRSQRTFLQQPGPPAGNERRGILPPGKQPWCRRAIGIPARCCMQLMPSVLGKFFPTPHNYLPDITCRRDTWADFFRLCVVGMGNQFSIVL